MTPSFQLQPRFRRSPCNKEMSAGPTGAALRRLFRPFGGLKARPLTLPVATWFNLLEPRGPRERTPCDTDRNRRPGSLPPRRRQEARLPRSGAPSIDRCSQAHACAWCPGTRHRSRRCCHLRAGFRQSTSFSPERPSGPHLRGSPSNHPWKTCTTSGPGLAPRTLADQICRLSTSAITTVLEHDHGSDRHPARPAEGYPSALR